MKKNYQRIIQYLNESVNNKSPFYRSIKQLLIILIIVLFGSLMFIEFNLDQTPCRIVVYDGFEFYHLEEQSTYFITEGSKQMMDTFFTNLVYQPGTLRYYYNLGVGTDSVFHYGYKDFNNTDIEGLSEQSIFRSNAYDSFRDCYWIAIYEPESLTCGIYKLNKNFTCISEAVKIDDIKVNSFQVLSSFIYITPNGSILWGEEQNIYRSTNGLEFNYIADVGFWGVTHRTASGTLYGGHYGNHEYGYTSLSDAYFGIYKSEDDGATWNLIWNEASFDYFINNNLTADYNGQTKPEGYNHVHDVYFDDVNDYLYATLGDGFVSSIIRAKYPIQNTNDFTMLANKRLDGEPIQMVPIMRIGNFMYAGRDGNKLDSRIYRFQDNGSTYNSFLENDSSFEVIYDPDFGHIENCKGYYFDVSTFKGNDNITYTVWALRETKTSRLSSLKNLF